MYYIHLKIKHIFYHNCMLIFLMHLFLCMGLYNNYLILNWILLRIRLLSRSIFRFCLRLLRRIFVGLFCCREGCWYRGLNPLFSRRSCGGMFMECLILWLCRLHHQEVLQHLIYTQLSIITSLDLSTCHHLQPSATRYSPNFSYNSPKYVPSWQQIDH